MSKLRDDEAKERKLQERRELVDQIGKEGKEGIRNFKEYVKKQEELEEKKKLHKLQDIEEKRRSRFTYNRFLAETLISLLKDIEWPNGWFFKVVPNEIGVIMELEFSKKFFRSAFRSTGMGEYDLNAVETFAIRAEYTLNRKTKGGILLPNGQR